MKTKTENTVTDKATARPWATDIEVPTFDGAQMEICTIYVNHGSGKGGEICAFRHDPEDGLDNTSEEQIHNARLIVRAVNEYDALCAVAEASKLEHQALCKLIEYIETPGYKRVNLDVRDVLYPARECRFNSSEAIVKLAALRAGKEA